MGETSKMVFCYLIREKTIRCNNYLVGSMPRPERIRT